MGIKDLIDATSNLVTSVLIPLAFSLCLLYFFWGIAKYIKGAGNEKALADGKNTMVWGVVALFVLSTVWGIIYFIRGELQIFGPETINIKNSL